MEKSWTTITRNTAGRRALLVATFLGLSAGPAKAYAWLPNPSIEVRVAPSSQSEKLGCSVSQKFLPAGTSRILVRIKVPQDSTLRTILLKTTSAELALEVTDSLPLVGEYETIIETEKTNCATSGTLILEVDGGLHTKTATCSGILLPKTPACSEWSVARSFGDMVKIVAAATPWAAIGAFTSLSSKSLDTAVVPKDLAKVEQLSRLIAKALACQGRQADGVECEE